MVSNSLMQWCAILFLEYVNFVMNAINFPESLNIKKLNQELDDNASLQRGVHLLLSNIFFFYNYSSFTYMVSPK